MDTESQIAQALDSVHENARAGFLRRDATAALAPFSPTLQYRQVDGRIIGYSQLLSQVETQLRRLSAAATAYRRESLAIGDDHAAETLVQSAWGCGTAFGIVHRGWRIRRRSRWTWRLMGSAWQVHLVEVLEEHVSPAGLSFGRRPAAPALG
jgi:hypothetical protein